MCKNAKQEEKSEYGWNQLIREVVNHSQADIWEEAVLEWNIVDYDEDEARESECICGHEGLRHLYSIQNEKTGAYLSPIGSTCIRLFQSEKMNEDLLIWEAASKIADVKIKGGKIDFTKKYFSRKLLSAMNHKGLFPPNAYNGWDGENDYHFLLDLFNSNKKKNMTKKQKYRMKKVLNRALGKIVVQAEIRKRKLKIGGCCDAK